MAVQIRWLDDDKRIVIQTYQGDWTIKDFMLTVNRTYRLLETVDYPVDVITDFTKSARGPVHLQNLGRHMEKHTSANQRLIIFVGANQYIRTMGAIAKRVSPGTPFIHYVQTLDEAQTFIQSHLAHT